MLMLCGEFGNKFSVSYNPLRTLCVIFSQNRIKPPIPSVQVKRTLVQWKDQFKHLGSYFESNLREMQGWENEEK